MGEVKSAGSGNPYFWLLMFWVLACCLLLSCCRPTLLEDLAGIGKRHSIKIPISNITDLNYTIDSLSQVYEVQFTSITFE